MKNLMKLDVKGSIPESAIPGYLCSEFERPNKKDAIKKRQTWFAQLK